MNSRPSPEASAVFSLVPSALQRCMGWFFVLGVIHLSASWASALADSFQRVANATLNVPSNPPATAFQLVPAFTDVAIVKPTCLASPPGDTRRLFFCEKNSGKIKCIPDVTAASPVSYDFLSLSDLATFDDQGVLGLAFHPNYGPNPTTQNTYCYVFYSWKNGALSYSRLSRFTVKVLVPGTEPSATSELILIQQLDRAGYHPGGDLHFGPDGYLYISLGDEGEYHDSLNNAQHIDGNFFSAIARIDVDRKPGSLEPNVHPAVLRDAGVARYAIPPDNPFIGATSFNGLPVQPSAVWTEFWAVGLRHPWRFSFDALTGELWCGDVGEGGFEEINLITRGGNYGWSFREGAHPGSKSGTEPPGFTSLDPIFEMPHINAPGDPNFKGNSVIGGFVYRGTRISALSGRYVFGDYITGNIWAAERTGTNSVNVQRIAGQTGIAAFGSDPSNGDILIADNDNDRILRLVATTITNSYPATLSATGLFPSLPDLLPAPGLLPYAVNLPFWSDYAIKSRWFIIPDAISTMTWSRDGLWSFPDGQIWVKHFDMEMQRGNPAIKKRIETRLLVKNAAGAYGVSYRWNEAGTDATLVADGGEDFDISLTVGGSPYVQHWSIPSRAECLACHTPQAGHALSFNTRQINLTHTISGFTGNQLALLQGAGYFSNSPGSPNLLPRHIRPDETSFPAEARVRSYLAVNCSYCHKAGGTAPSQWDGRPELTLDQTGLINALANNNGSNLAIVLSRMAGTNGFTRMPPLASNELDQTNIALVTDWIANSLPSRQTYADWRLAHFGSSTSAAGDSAADPDGDGATNAAEFLWNTQPLSGASFPALQIGLPGSTTTLTINVPSNRSAKVETSTDLATWSLWDVPGNAGNPTTGGPFTLTGPTLGPKQFFRVRIQDN